MLAIVKYTTLECNLLDVRQLKVWAPGLRAAESHHVGKYGVVVRTAETHWCWCEEQTDNRLSSLSASQWVFLKVNDLSGHFLQRTGNTTP